MWIGLKIFFTKHNHYDFRIVSKTLIIVIYPKTKRLKIGHLSFWEISITLIVSYPERHIHIKFPCPTLQSTIKKKCYKCKTYSWFEIENNQNVLFPNFQLEACTKSLLSVGLLFILSY